MKYLVAFFGIVSVASLLTLVLCMKWMVEIIDYTQTTSIVTFKAGLELGCYYNKQITFEECKKMSDIETQRLIGVIK